MQGPKQVLRLLGTTLPSMPTAGSFSPFSYGPGCMAQITAVILGVTMVTSNDGNTGFPVFQRGIA
jgi:hypothetical protein